MKPIIKYISLLLFSGLILPFCNSTDLKKASAPNDVKIILPGNKIYLAATGQIEYFIYQDIAEMLLPQPKN
jgi:hypothetical protein